MNPCVIIPVYNAAASLPPLLAALRQQPVDVLVVDDGSTDATASVAERAGVRLASHASNRGKGAALRSGLAEALRAGHELIITMDADGQHDPADIPRLLEAAREHPQAGLIIGNRMTDVHAMPRLRRWTNRLMSRGLSRRAGVQVPDTQCGFRLLRSSFAHVCRLMSDHFEIESELVLEAGRLRVPVVSVPIRTIYAGESSHIHPLRDTVRFFRMLRAYRRRHQAST